MVVNLHSVTVDAGRLLSLVLAARYLTLLVGLLVTLRGTPESRRPEVFATFVEPFAPRVGGGRRPRGGRREENVGVLTHAAREDRPVEEGRQGGD
jgi:hypothetical protein